MPGANKSCIKCNKSHYYNSELEELVTELLVTHEELEHLQMVHDLIKKPNFKAESVKTIMLMNFLSS
jgi:tRNA isopentenyl-2-thiomethyl-A-37 hydroxylase MiaE